MEEGAVTEARVSGEVSAAPPVVQSAMCMSDDVSQAIGPLIAAQKKIEAAVKAADNPYFKSKYADLAAVSAAAKPALNEAGFAILQFPSSRQLGAPIVTEKVRNGETRTVVRVLTEVMVRTVLLHESGQWFAANLTCTVADSDAATVGSAVTYLRRYSFMPLAFVVAVGEDDDGNGARDDNAEEPRNLRRTQSRSGNDQPRNGNGRQPNQQQQRQQRQEKPAQAAGDKTKEEPKAAAADQPKGDATPATPAATADAQGSSNEIMTALVQSFISVCKANGVGAEQVVDYLAREHGIETTKRQVPIALCQLTPAQLSVAEQWVKDQSVAA